jgi:hypothetical protein
VNPYNLAWFLASIFGASFPTLTQAQYDYAFVLAESELASVKCWCAKLYPTALQIKISLILSTSGMGGAVVAPPVLAPVGGSYEAYVSEDEVFDVRRKYKVVEKSKTEVKAAATSGPAGQLEAIVARCKPPLGIGATIAAGINSVTGGCCNHDFYGADKAFWFHGFEH